MIDETDDNDDDMDDPAEHRRFLSLALSAPRIETKMGTDYLQSSLPREQPKTHRCLSPNTTSPITSPTTTLPITSSTTSSLDRSISPSVALSCDRVEQTICRGDRGAVTTVYPPYAIAVTLPLPEQPED